MEDTFVDTLSEMVDHIEDVNSTRTTSITIIRNIKSFLETHNRLEANIVKLSRKMDKLIQQLAKNGVRFSHLSRESGKDPVFQLHREYRVKAYHYKPLSSYKWNEGKD